jgi:hypothetical protein
MTPGQPLIVSRISGGLGNQLFQYAAGLALALRIGAEFKLDLSWYKSELRDDRRFNLGHFNIDAALATNDDMRRLETFKLVQDMTIFDRRILDRRGDTHLCGYWVGAQYFEGADEAVRKAFAFSNPLVADYAKRYVQQVRTGSCADQVVAMHVRRGDNTRVANFNRFQIHPNLFYELAANAFPSGTAFIVFSDGAMDMEWCRANIPRRADCHYNFCDGHGWLFDFAIMAACDHLIKSMSTFSWWAAWLNPSPDRIVIAPHPLQGIGPQYAHVRQDDYILPDWQVIALPPG